jgi:transcriptional regulator GlxA family with amidase domain
MISRWICLKKSGASALFKSQTNISIIGYLTELRLYRAQSALANSDEKIVNIALDAGFGSMSQFYEIFHRATGLTPQKYLELFAGLLFAKFTP